MPSPLLCPLRRRCAGDAMDGLMKLFLDVQPLIALVLKDNQTH